MNTPPLARHRARVVQGGNRESPNTLIAFCAKAEPRRPMANDRLSPVTAALVKYLPRPGLDLRKAFGFVRGRGSESPPATGQEPFVYGSLGGGEVGDGASRTVPPQTQSPPTLPRRKGATTKSPADQCPRRGDSFHQQNPQGLLYDPRISPARKLKAAKAAATRRCAFAAERNALERARIRGRRNGARLAAEVQAGVTPGAAAERPRKTH